MRCFLLTALILTGCRTTAPDDSATKTDLRNNDEVTAAFEQYQRQEQHCRPARNVKRALVTGFGLFGSPFNISGIVAMNLVQPGFTPDAFTTSDAAGPADPSAMWTHGDTRPYHGGAVAQRTLVIDGETVEVCALLLDVQWDLAAAIILHEASLFRPDVIIMAGANGREDFLTTFESGAVNNAKAYAGFDSTGRPISANIPVRALAPIVPSLPPTARRALSWDAEMLARETLPVIRNIRPVYGSQVGEIRAENNYICNNVSFAVSAGLSGMQIELAGGQIVWPATEVAAKIGFLHLPWESTEGGHADDPDEVFGWVKVLAASIAYSLPDS